MSNCGSLEEALQPLYVGLWHILMP